MVVVSMASTDCCRIDLRAILPRGTIQNCIPGSRALEFGCVSQTLKHSHCVYEDNIA